VGNSDQFPRYNVVNGVVFFVMQVGGEWRTGWGEGREGGGGEIKRDEQHFGATTGHFVNHGSFAAAATLLALARAGGKWKNHGLS
jgi:hypothetical protein